MSGGARRVEADGMRREARDMRRMAYAGERKRELDGGW